MKPMWISLILLTTFSMMNNPAYAHQEQTEKGCREKFLRNEALKTNGKWKNNGKSRTGFQENDFCVICQEEPGRPQKCTLWYIEEGHPAVKIRWFAYHNDFSPDKHLTNEKPHSEFQVWVRVLIWVSLAVLKILCITTAVFALAFLAANLWIHPKSVRCITVIVLLVYLTTLARIPDPRQHPTTREENMWVK